MYFDHKIVNIYICKKAGENIKSLLFYFSEYISLEINAYLLFIFYKYKQ